MSVTSRLALRALLPLLLLVLSGASALASHYSLSKVDFVSAHERKQLAKAGIHDTEVLLEWVSTRQNRRWLTKQTGIAEDRLLFWAARCDLLRIVGIGPSIADALQKAEVLDALDLARDEAPGLLARLKVATRGTGMAQRLPAEDTLATWIAAAQRLRTVIDFDPWEVQALVKLIRTGRERAQLLPGGPVLPPP